MTFPYDYEDCPAFMKWVTDLDGEWKQSHSAYYPLLYLAYKAGSEHK